MKTIPNLNCVIVDDEPLARQVLHEYAGCHPDLIIQAEYGDPIEACKNIDRLQPDLLFLDIQMPELNGFELLQKLHRIPVTIFCTAYDEYAILAFEKNAVDYLLKPFNQKRFDKALEKARAYVLSKAVPHNLDQLFHYLKQNKTEKTRLLVKDGDHIRIFEPEAIFWIEAKHDYCLLHTRKGNFLVSKTMQQLQNLLMEFTFRRVHRSALVNFNLVKDIKPWSSGRYLLLLKNGDEIESSKSGAKQIKEMIL